ncbi:hypothetical protein SAMN04487983_1011130 [Streptomyces sp. yr375]|uniref:hypothetical protein n=1 Tax=Streptomyces sp. yr375 TaxID=1761906 RepID=UPI0008C61C1F|nr:hypothetical protein [Streptomyces sp. yr375]SER12741.1 hypothetical protein SAMN04487983_1011130 [Streptomyces sp. yr375]
MHTYALIVPASTPSVRRAAVMAPAWREDRILPTPPAEPSEVPVRLPDLLGDSDTSLTPR